MGISVNQLLIILAIVVLLFGAKKIPELAKGVGKGIKSFKKEMSEDEPNEQITKSEPNGQSTQNTESKNA